MALPHYESEYDESLIESITQEFGPELAEAILECKSLPPQLERALRKASRECRDERTRFLGQLQREYRNIEEANRALQTICDTVESCEQSSHTGLTAILADIWDRLDSAEADCRELLIER